MTEVTLNEILAARDERAKKQKSILSRFKYPLVSFTMNIAGPIKTSPLIERSFFEGIKLLKERLPQDSIVYENTNIKITGCEAIFSVKCNPAELKDICTSIEDSSPIGRLYDMDVIATDESKLQRKNPRSCIVCGSQGMACAAGRVHSVSEIQAITTKIMQDHFFNTDKHLCSFLAVKSLLDEVYTTPKPGLVDCRNNGSHTDMDINTFEKSAYVLKPYFEECFSIGNSTSALSPDEVFLLLRNVGIAAEKTMFDTTGGVNTHKGAIYSMGILCGAIGRLWTPETPFASIEDICSHGASFVKEDVKKYFEKIDTSTNGGKVCSEYGLKGIRGEVASGFDSVLEIGLPCYKRLIHKNPNQNDAGAITLLYLISGVKDTNLYHRGQGEGANYAVKIVKELLAAFPEPEKKQVESLDDEFIRLNLSPGGCADLLAITYFLYNIEAQK